MIQPLDVVISGETYSGSELVWFIVGVLAIVALLLYIFGAFPRR
jgi:hypothetical protein